MRLSPAVAWPLVALLLALAAVPALADEPGGEREPDGGVEHDGWAPFRHPRPTDDDVERAEEGGGHLRLRVSALALLGVGLIPDTDDPAPFDDGGPGFDPDVDLGEGFAVRLGVGAEGIDLGLLYELTEHEEITVGGRVQTHAAYLELRVARNVASLGPFDVLAHAAVGGGGAFIDFSDPFDDTGGLAGEARLQLGLKAWDAVELVAGGGAFLWGYPGETLGYGHQATAGLSLAFSVP